MNCYEKLNIPENCKINRTIFKKTFYENVSLSKSDKALFSDTIEKITWLYCLNKDTLNVAPYQTNEREYIEIEVIEATLTAEKGIKRIAEIIMRTIPYPMMLFFRFENKYQLFLAHQRFNLADNSKITLDEFISTDWLDDSSTLWDKLNISKFRFTNFFDMYSDIADSVSIHNAQCLIHKENITGEQARELIRRNNELEGRITALRAELKKETQFNKKMEINMEIKKLQKLQEDTQNANT